MGDLKKKVKIMEHSTTKKRMLFVAAKANMIEQFNKRNILIAQELGYEVYVATDFQDFGSMDKQTNENLKAFLSDIGVHYFQVSFERGVGSFSQNLKAILALKKIFKVYDIDIVHAHSPIGAAITRIAAVGSNLKTIYTAHGFHFFKAGPKINWLFFPLEWILSYLTDTLITINAEDFELAESKFHQKNLYRIAGVGIDVAKAYSVPNNEKINIRNKLRKELDIDDRTFVVLAVGELSKRKNHKLIVEALHQINDERIMLMIAGVGPLKEYLQSLVDEYGMHDRVRFLDYRQDVNNLHYASDLNVFPSLREGLGLSGLEALVDGMFVIGSKGTGMEDYITSDSLGFLIDPNNAEELANAIQNAFDHKLSPDLVSYKESLFKFDKSVVDETMKKIYQSYLD